MFILRIELIYLSVFFFQAEDGIRDLVRSRGLGDVYKRQGEDLSKQWNTIIQFADRVNAGNFEYRPIGQNSNTCLLYTSDAADERSSVDLGGRRIIKKKTSSRVEGR